MSLAMLIIGMMVPMFVSGASWVADKAKAVTRTRRKRATDR